MGIHNEDRIIENTLKEIKKWYMWKSEGKKQTNIYNVTDENQRKKERKKERKAKWTKIF